MGRNRFRDSPGRTLVGYSVLVFLTLAASVQDWWAEGLEWTELPTGVEDQDFYVPAEFEAPGAPALRFAGWPEEYRRLSEKPLVLRDFRMRKIGRDAADRVFIYRQADASPGKDDGSESSSEEAPQRIFVKVADDRYVEIGRVDADRRGAADMPGAAGSAPTSGPANDEGEADAEAGEGSLVPDQGEPLDRGSD